MQIDVLLEARVQLPYSDAIYCQVFPHECTETFQEGHKRAFQFFAGVFKTHQLRQQQDCRAKTTGGRGREVTGEFLRLEGHYLFEHHFCLVRRTNEIGHVENLIGYSRRNFQVPIPQTDSLEGLSLALEQRCRQELNRKVRGKSAASFVPSRVRVADMTNGVERNDLRDRFGHEQEPPPPASTEDRLQPLRSTFLMPMPAMNEFLAAAPQAVPFASHVGLMTSLHDYAGRPGRPFELLSSLG